MNRLRSLHLLSGYILWQTGWKIGARRSGRHFIKSTAFRVPPPTCHSWITRKLTYYVLLLDVKLVTTSLACAARDERCLYPSNSVTWGSEQLEIYHLVVDRKESFYMPWPVPPLPLDNPEEAQQYIERLTLQTQQLCEASFSDDDEPPATKPTRIRLRVPETQLPTDTPQVEKPVDDLHHSAQQTTDPAMVANTRRSARNSNHTQPSGSEYSGAGSAHSGSVTSQSPAAETRSNRRARATGKKYDYDDDEFDDYAQPASQPVMTTTTSSRGRTIRLRNPNMILSDDDDDDAPPRAAGTRGGLRSAQSKKRRNSFIDDEENGEEDEDDPEAGYNTRSRKPKDEPKDDAEAKPPTRSRLKKGSKRRTARQRDEEGDYVDDGISHSEQDLDADGSVDHDDPVPSTPEEPSRRPQSPEEAPGYGLRKRTAKVNYALPPPLALEEIGPGINGNSNGGVDNVFLNGASNKGKGKPLPKDYRKVIPWGVGPRFGGPAGRVPPRRGAADDSVRSLNLVVENLLT